jgi:hypothetical protein
MVYTPKNFDPYDTKEVPDSFYYSGSNDVGGEEEFFTDSHRGIHVYEFRNDSGFYEDLLEGSNPEDDDIRRLGVHRIIEEAEMDPKVREIGRLYFGLGSKTYDVPYGRGLFVRDISKRVELPQSKVLGGLTQFVSILSRCNIKRRLACFV